MDQYCCTTYYVLRHCSTRTGTLPPPALHRSGTPAASQPRHGASVARDVAWYESAQARLSPMPLKKEVVQEWFTCQCAGNCQAPGTMTPLAPRGKGLLGGRLGAFMTAPGLVCEACFGSRAKLVNDMGRRLAVVAGKASDKQKGFKHLQYIHNNPYPLPGTP